jgi:hypothetical protein
MYLCLMVSLCSVLVSVKRLTAVSFSLRCHEKGLPGNRASRGVLVRLPVPQGASVSRSSVYLQSTTSLPRQRLRRSMQTLARCGESVVVDLSETVFIDSTIIYTLIEADSNLGASRTGCSGTPCAPGSR